MSRAAWFARAAGVVLAAALALTACAPPGSEPTTPGNTAGTAAANGGTLRYHLYQQPTSFDPFHALQGADGEISGLHFRALIRGDKETFAGVLAKSWTVSPDAKTFTFTLQDTKWSDGTPFTSADVVWSFETYSNPKVASIFAGQLAPVEGYAAVKAGSATSFSGISAPDDKTVVIKLSEPNAAFLPNLTALAVVPKHIYSAIAPDKLKGAPEFREPKVGIGPYIFKRWVTDDQIEFQPNANSFEAHPLDSLFAQYLAADVARAQLETGEIDIAQVASADVKSVRASGKVTVQIAEGKSLMSLYTALDSGKLADVRVRQAITHAIDRQAIVDNVLAGNGRVVDTNLFTPAWAIPNDLVQYKYDPEKAKQLLAEAGWKAETEVNLDIVPGQADRDAVMNIVLGQLKAVGINAKLHTLQPAELTKLVEERKFDLLITVMGLQPGEPGSINVRFMCDGGQNVSKYCNPELDALLKQGVATSDQAKRTEIYQQVARILNRDLPAIPLYVANQPWGSTARVQGFDPNVGALGAAQNWSVKS